MRQLSDGQREILAERKRDSQGELEMNILHGIELKPTVGGYVGIINGTTVAFRPDAPGFRAHVIPFRPEADAIYKQTLGECVLAAKVASGAVRNKPICNPGVGVDFSSGYVGDGYDGVYYFVSYSKFLDRFYTSTLIDSETGHFCMPGTIDAGPFETWERAEECGYQIGLEWCLENQIKPA